MINVTKTYLPNLEKYQTYLQKIWQNGWITNNGELVRELENRLAAEFKVKYCILVANGTLALQLPLKMLNITGEVITTPYSYVATTNAILWGNAAPVFADIDPKTGCLNPENIESLITSKTQAILPVHVYGLPCRIEEIETIARKHNLKVIYDAAHAFGVTYKGKPLVAYGDISTLSFHATKLFHTVEGGAILTNNDEYARQLKLLRAFGHINDDYFGLGINAKMSELHAAMGLCVLDDMDKIIQQRKADYLLYRKLLENTSVTFFDIPENTGYNYSYFPVVFQSEQQMLQVKQALLQAGINARRYFYPSLNTLPQIQHKQPCSVSEDIASRVLCLPHFYGNTNETISEICAIIKQTAV